MGAPQGLDLLTSVFSQPLVPQPAAATVTVPNELDTSAPGQRGGVVRPFSRQNYYRGQTPVPGSGWSSSLSWASPPPSTTPGLGGDQKVHKSCF